MVQTVRMLGLAGPTGSGKTTLARALAEELREEDPRVLPLDAYYRDLSALSPREREGRDFDDPEALDRELLGVHLRDLSRGRTVERPHYDFGTHTRGVRGVEVSPGGWVILEGLYSLYWEEIRGLLDLKAFVDVREEVSLERRLKRDVRERGRSPQSVIRQFRESVRPSAQRYLVPTRRYADVVVSGEDPVEVSARAILGKVREGVGR